MPQAAGSAGAAGGQEAGRCLAKCWGVFSDGRVEAVVAAVRWAAVEARNLNEAALRSNRSMLPGTNRVLAATDGDQLL